VRQPRYLHRLRLSGGDLGRCHVLRMHPALQPGLGAVGSKHGPVTFGIAQPPIPIRAVVVTMYKTAAEGAGSEHFGEIRRWVEQLSLPEQPVFYSAARGPHWR
jgi:hypothetical protein